MYIFTWGTTKVFSRAFTINIQNLTLMYFFSRYYHQVSIHLCIQINQSLKHVSFLRQLIARSTTAIVSCCCWAEFYGVDFSVSRLRKSHRDSVLKKGSSFGSDSIWFSNINSFVIQIRCGLSLSPWKMTPRRLCSFLRSDTTLKTYGKNVFIY